MSRENLSSGKFFDPAILRKSAIVDDSFTLNAGSLPLPSIVELSPSGTYNRVCDFCPRNDPAYPNNESFMAMELIEKLTREAFKL